MTVAETKTRIQISNVLLATDFSKYSEGALAYAAAMARRCGAMLYITHVIAADLLSLIAANARESSLEERRHQAVTRMADLRSSDELSGTQHRAIIAEGKVGEMLTMLVGERDIDLVVVGTRGHTGMKKLFLGSVAEEILGLVPCPVLTVGGRRPGVVPNDAEFQSIIAAVDFSAESMVAAEYGISLAQQLQARLTLVHIVEKVTPNAAADKVSLEKPFLKKLRRLNAEESEPPLQIERVVEFGDPSTLILKTVADRQSDLIVIGARRAEAFAAHLMRSTAYRVISDAPCPVLTVRNSPGRPAVGDS